LVDKTLNILVCNAAFGLWVSNFTGTAIKEGENVLFDGKNELYQNKFEMCYALALSGKCFRSVEDVVIDGRTCFTSICFNPVWKGDTVIGVSCSATDITEQRQQLRQIEHQNTALREIAFIESHKIRGPVATILGLEQFYNYEDLSDPFNGEIMEGIKKLSLELDMIIREVVRMSNEIDV
jgi:sensor histidine kinase regulating citrate/malate metabolism